jgi:hypothetical protein
MKTPRKVVQNDKRNTLLQKKAVVEEVPKNMLYSSAPKRAGDSRISETTTHNSSSPAFNRR